MSLIGNSSGELTASQQASSQIFKMSNSVYEHMKRQHNYIWKLIWSNRNGASPQEVLDGMGTDASELFTFSIGIQGMLYQADNTYIPMTPPYEYVINDDGTVTVGDLIPVEIVNPSE
jgi:hypothetical protein